jgi:hypothetical protein
MQSGSDLSLRRLASQGDHRATLINASAVQVTLGADDLMVKQ